MRLRAPQPTAASHKVLVVDDDAELLESTVRLLRRDGHDVASATTEAEAVEKVRSWRPHLVLLDYYLRECTGESVARSIRELDELCQVLLVTGYASEQPARKLLAELDIQGYHDKADGPQRLMILVDAALKHFRALQRIDRQRRHLRHVLDVAPRITAMQPVDTLLEVALYELSGLLRGGDGFIATSNSGLFVLGSAQETVSVHAATGRFAGMRSLSELPSAIMPIVASALDRTTPYADEGRYVVVPLQTRGGDRGCMIVESAELHVDAVEACEIYARQVTQALENVMLYERATVDGLTRLYTRDYGLQRLHEAFSLGSRTDEPTSVVLLDIDHFKRVNDTFGHAAGDLVLRAVATAMRQECRLTDVASRHGGEEFLLVLPATDSAGARVLAERVRTRLSREQIVFDGVTITVTASFGVASIEADTYASFEPDELIKRADDALYAAKRGGRDSVVVYEPDMEHMNASAA
jgi:two-component system, cell cycle response regulator